VSHTFGGVDLSPIRPRETGAIIAGLTLDEAALRGLDAAGPTAVQPAGTADTLDHNRRAIGELFEAVGLRPPPDPRRLPEPVALPSA
jgi:hypothetical protein